MKTKQLVAWPLSTCLHAIGRLAYLVADRVYLPDTPNPPWWFGFSYKVYFVFTSWADELDEWAERK